MLACSWLGEPERQLGASSIMAHPHASSAGRNYTCNVSGSARSWLQTWRQIVNYTTLRELGAGAIGVVHHVRMANGRDAAMKEYKVRRVDKSFVSQGRLHSNLSDTERVEQLVLRVR